MLNDNDNAVIEKLRIHKLTSITVEPIRCPMCFSSNINADDYEPEDAVIFQKVFCDKCEFDWVETYIFSLANTSKGDVNKEPFVCPSCQSGDIHAGKTESHGEGVITRSGHCDDCADEWEETYLFSGCSQAPEKHTSSLVPLNVEYHSA